jgi:hypothetical protein
LADTYFEIQDFDEGLKYMETSQEFTGLGMPVFMAFGWAGEETAIKYALSQLELFALKLHGNLPQAMQEELPYVGLSEEIQSSYMAAAEAIDDDVHILINARPASLEVQVALTNKEALTKCWKQLTKKPDSFQQLLAGLETEWTLRVQQIHINEDTGDRGHYQDIFKDSQTVLDKERAQEIFEKAEYLNSEDQWVVPIYLSQRIPAEQASVMQGEIIPVMVERLSPLAPVIVMLRGRSARKAVRAAATKKPTKKPLSELTVAAPPAAIEPPTAEGFTFISQLKPLHIRRGFINMTPEYWPFFAINARTESRHVTVISESLRDEDSSVWRLQPNNMARLVLSPRAQRWLEENFVAGDSIQLTATKNSADEIQIVLDMTG